MFAHFLPTKGIELQAARRFFFYARTIEHFPAEETGRPGVYNSGIPLLGEGSVMIMGGFPSGQRGQTVNLLAMPSKVRILLHPLRARCVRSYASAVRVRSNSVNKTCSQQVQMMDVPMWLNWQSS